MPAGKLRGRRLGFGGAGGEDGSILTFPIFFQTVTNLPAIESLFDRLGVIGMRERRSSLLDSPLEIGRGDTARRAA